MTDAAKVLGLAGELKKKPGAPLRRPAAAGRDGPGDRARAARLPDGRAAVEPRREAARPDARRDRPDPARPRGDDDLRDARPERGDDARRPGRGDARRAAAAGRHPAGALRPPGQPVRRGLHRGAADEPAPCDARAPRRRASRYAWARRRSRFAPRPSPSGRRSRGTSIVLLPSGSGRRISRTRPSSPIRHGMRACRPRSTSARTWGRRSTSTFRSPPSRSCPGRLRRRATSRPRRIEPPPAFVARVDRDTRAREGEPIELVVDTTRLHFFDLETGAAV